jgi:hypothetical protein
MRKRCDSTARASLIEGGGARGASQKIVPTETPSAACFTSCPFHFLGQLPRQENTRFYDAGRGFGLRSCKRGKWRGERSEAPCETKPERNAAAEPQTEADRCCGTVQLRS